MRKRLCIALVCLTYLFCGGVWAENKQVISIPLKKALQFARERNENYLLSEEKLKRAGLARQRAWAALMPNLSVGGTFTHTNKEIGFSGRVIQRQDYFAGSGAVSLSLFHGPAIPGVIRSYKQVEAASHQASFEKTTFDFEVARAYFAVLASQNLVAAAQRSLATTEEQLLATKARRAAGEALGVDETRARIEVVSAQGQLERAQNTLATELDYLGFLMGVEQPFSLEPHEVLAPNKKTYEPLSQVIQNRSDVRAASLRTEALKISVTEGWMDFLPELSVTGNYRLTQNTGWAGDVDSWNIVFSLNWLLFDGGYRRVTVKESASTLVESKLQRQQMVRDIRREIRQAERDLKSAQTTLFTAEEKLRLAKENQSMVMSRYRAGLATSLEVVEATDALAQSEVSVVSEQFNLSLKRLELLASLGMSPLGEEIDAP